MAAARGCRASRLALIPATAEQVEKTGRNPIHPRIQFGFIGRRGDDDRIRAQSGSAARPSWRTASTATPRGTFVRLRLLIFGTVAFAGKLQNEIDPFPFGISCRGIKLLTFQPQELDGFLDGGLFEDDCGDDECPYLIENDLRGIDPPPLRRTPPGLGGAGAFSSVFPPTFFDSGSAGAPLPSPSFGTLRSGAAKPGVSVRQPRAAPARASSKDAAPNQAGRPAVLVGVRARARRAGEPSRDEPWRSEET